MDGNVYLKSTKSSLAGNVAAMTEPLVEIRMAEERLPFTVKIVRSEEELRKAVYVRHAAYARHLPALANLLRVPEIYDHEAGTVVLLAESKLDGSPLGSMRIQTNHYSRLGIEHSVRLPAWLQNRSLAEATRLGVTEGQTGRVVKSVLFKAYFDYCVEQNIEWMVITARSPLDRQYEALLFKDAFPGGEFIPMHHVGNIPHRVMAFEVESAENRWAAANHPLFNFIFRTCHPDIHVTGDTPIARRSDMRRSETFGRLEAAA